ncbi:S-adenosyl-L-methionine-dependent methyltransferase [Bimuria novae-zelandiae CBS 107.79]|uniref:S-adenosyl-L-methionine-dependent methyltransferase n=1 Tax=Bimuria novae-zelandiae CBS 107.79 TaxID=1447943 RepID=A0A6A5UU23_9PLEO|nr:S-adenosyl-L-methionine-dependent methyltransferase [Bimuria novae-zelandiae CBS 107.79]
MSPTPYVSALQTFYNTVSKSYNAQTSTIHAGGPDRLVAAAAAAGGVFPGAHVLDLATGTGKIAFAAARKVLPGGSVLGIDISESFLALASHAAEELGVASSVTFLQRDVADLSDLPGREGDGRWADAVTCGSAIAMFPSPKTVLNVLAKEVLKPGGVFVADLWAPHVPAKIFLDVAVPRGFEAPFEPAWLSDTEVAFRRVFEGTGFELRRVDKVGGSTSKWDVGTEEKVEVLWRNLAVEQTWLSFGLEKMSVDVVEGIKWAWVQELGKYGDGEGVVVAEMGQWVAVAVARE